MTAPSHPRAQPSAGSDLLGTYRPHPGVYDEMVDAKGSMRQHWAWFGEAVAELGGEGLTERRRSAQQLLKEHGVTYNVHADGRSDERPWKLDLLPLILDAREWARLERGLVQRTRLLDLVLEDLYGPQRILRDGLSPSALLHANPGFLRACHGIKPVGGRFLTLHAVDLTRAPNGDWWVLADRTQAPSGVGYTLENRTITSRLMSEEMRAGRVRPLASFFNERKDGLRAMAPQTDSPTIVLLTPGPYTETYFEHAYLARFLGYPLVEGSDLVVRDRRVFLKTLEGLQPVDVIIRRIDDTYCDPLELRSDSMLGISGLVDAARAGNVAISNALGSGAVEAPALLAFLPALAKRLLSEELLIPNVATWWCGQERERAFTLGNLEHMVVKSAFVGRGSGDPAFVENMPRTDLDRLRARIAARPHDFVAQERVALSTAPVWRNDGVIPFPLILRCFVCATPTGYIAMPGGLTRVSGSPDSPVVTSKHGGGSKDTWVLASDLVALGPVAEISRPVHEQRRNVGVVPSRYAENIYWLGRNAERLEDHSRLLRTVLARLAGEGSADDLHELKAMTSCLVELKKLPPTFASSPPRPMLLKACQDLIFSPEIPGSAGELLVRINYLTASLRDRLSGDTWRILNQTQSEFNGTPRTADASVLLRTLHRLIFHLAAFSGMEMENMTRGHSWHFLQIGRRVERALNVIEVLRAILVTSPGGGHALAPLLEYCDSTMTYRRRYFSRPELQTTLDLLIADHTNPRPLEFHLSAIEEHLKNLPGAHAQQPEMLRFEILRQTMDQSGLLSLNGPASARGLANATVRLAQLRGDLRVLSDTLTERFFSHVQPRVQ